MSFVDMDEDNKRRFILFIGFVAIGFFLYFVFVIGAGYGCDSGGGVLLNNVNGMRCVNLSAVDVCRDYTGRIIDKPVSKFNATFNFSLG